MKNELTDNEKRIRIAEICGWKFTPTPKGGACTANWQAPSGRYTTSCPNFLNDLNAMHEAEKRLSDDQLGKYCHELNAICCRVSCGGENKLCGYTLHATARQRADAFLAVFDKEGGAK